MPRYHLGQTTFDAALERIIGAYEDGHRVVVTSSGGKDSTVTMEIALIAAKLTGNLPLDVVHRDEEVMLPGTFDYMERVAVRPEIRMRWVIANQPIVNVFNRTSPYFWTFDPLLPETDWVRTPPWWINDKVGYEAVKIIPEKFIQGISNTEVYPPPEGKKLIVLNGMRASESTNRLMGVYSSKGWLNKGANKFGSTLGKPIYDMEDADIWRTVKENDWDYNDAYDVMYRMGVKKRQMRIAPPTLMQAQWSMLELGRKAWPRWFDKVCNRLPGVRQVATFGKYAVYPSRHSEETWEECYQRVCIDDAPDWIRDRAEALRAKVIHRHSAHATHPVPQSSSCERCGPIGDWRRMTMIMYYGDPFTSNCAGYLPVIEPEFFREGAGTWGGTPTW